VFSTKVSMYVLHDILLYCRVDLGLR